MSLPGGRPNANRLERRTLVPKKYPTYIHFLTNDELFCAIKKNFGLSLKGEMSCKTSRRTFMRHRVNSTSDWLPKYKHHPTAFCQNTLTLRAPTRCSTWLAATNLMQNLFSMVEMSLQKFRLTSLFFGLTNVLSLSLDKNFWALKLKSKFFWHKFFPGMSIRDLPWPQSRPNLTCSMFWNQNLR